MFFGESQLFYCFEFLDSPGFTKYFKELPSVTSILHVYLMYFKSQLIVKKSLFYL